jgi:hypothetical protein
VRNREAPKRFALGHSWRSHQRILREELALTRFLFSEFREFGSSGVGRVKVGSHAYSRHAKSRSTFWLSAWSQLVVTTSGHVEKACA